MKASKLTGLSSFCTVMFFLHFFSRASASPDDSATPVCALNLTAYPYQPTSECIDIDDKEKISVWAGYQTNRCCRNALNTLSQALASYASKEDAIFLDRDHLMNCSRLFISQPSVSIDTCGFNALTWQSSQCSRLKLSNFKENKQYLDARDSCSGLESSFNDKCINCTEMIINATDYLLDQLQVINRDSERAICGIAVVISIAASNISNRQFIDNLYGCLPALDKLEAEEGYIKLKRSVARALLTVIIATMGVLLVIVLVKYVRKKKPLKPVQGKEVTAWSGIYRFSKAEIDNAINFDNNKVHLGAGSAGQVYKGILPSGQLVAIKHIYKSNKSDSFTREVEGLSRIRHPNLVCLLGCCIEGDEQYLVYEYCSEGNLARHLLRRDSVLPWDRRVKILRDCALALRYLHHYIDGCIVHRDIKLTNILLMEDMKPKLSDFGLAKMLGMEESKVFTDVRGTIGYMDPEYMSNAKLTCASDVYSFGIVMLQLLSGRKVIELDLDARDQLTRKAKDVIMGKRPLKDFEDPRLNGNFNIVDFESILQVAVLCVAKSSKGRPTIDVVFEELDTVWENTMASRGMMNTSSMNPLDTPHSRSRDVVSV